MRVKNWEEIVIAFKGKGYGIGHRSQIFISSQQQAFEKSKLDAVT